MPPKNARRKPKVEPSMQGPVVKLEDDSEVKKGKRARAETKSPSPRDHQQILNEPGPSMPSAQRSQQPQAGMSSNPDGQPASTTQPTQNATTGAFPPVPLRLQLLSQPTAMPRELAPNTPADVNRMQGVLNSPRIPPSFRASNNSNPNVSYAGDASGGNPNPGNRNFNNPQPFRGWNPILAAAGDPLLVYFYLPLNGLLGVSYQQSGQGVVFIPRDATLYQFKGEILDLVYSDFFNFESGIGPVVFEICRVFVRWVSIDGQSTANELVYNEELGRALAAMARRGFRDELRVYLVPIPPMSNAAQ